MHCHLVEIERRGGPLILVKKYRDKNTTVDEYCAMVIMEFLIEVVIGQQDDGLNVNYFLPGCAHTYSQIFMDC